MPPLGGMPPGKFLKNGLKEVNSVHNHFNHQIGVKRKKNYGFVGGQIELMVINFGIILPWPNGQNTHPHTLYSCSDSLKHALSGFLTSNLMEENVVIV